MNFSFCGPGTQLAKRLARGDTGINPLDEACKEHDLAYSQSNSLSDRHRADEILENRAWERVKAKNADFGEKAAAWSVTNIMKAKRKMGMGMKRKQRRRCKGNLSFRHHVLLPVHKTLQTAFKGSGLETHKDIRKSSLMALRAARAAIRKVGGRKKIRLPRIIPFEKKTGGILPLIPIFAGLSALGSLAGGASAISNAVINAKTARKKLEEDKRHHMAMEELKKGSGLYLRKTPKGGFGLFLKKQKNSH